MHENREISGASRSNLDRGRLAKAQSHNANMHAPEESDCAVVPMNQPNKGEQSSAEVGEGRARTKENIVPSNTSPTQSGERVSQGLSGVRQAAKERKQERFTALLHHASVGLLRDSFYALKRQAAPGVDGITWMEKPHASHGDARLHPTVFTTNAKQLTSSGNKTSTESTSSGPVSKRKHSSQEVVASYKSLSGVERAFRELKSAPQTLGQFADSLPRPKSTGSGRLSQGDTHFTPNGSTSGTLANCRAYRPARRPPRAAM